MEKVYLWVANLIFTAHVCLGIFFLVGWKFSHLQPLYLTLMIAWIGSWIFLGYCPLSRLEFSIRNKYNANINPYTEIIQHYIHKFLGIKIPSHRIVVAGLIVFSILVFLSLSEHEIIFSYI